MKNTITFLCLFLPLIAAGQTNTDIYLFDLSVKNNEISISNPHNIAPHKGYDNQPFFHDKLPIIYYASSNDSSRTDIKFYNYKTNKTQQLTATREREYSPTLTEDRKYISCIIQRDNGQQDLAKYPIEGGKPTVLVDNLKVGYHAWIDNSKLLLYVLTTPANELHYHDLATNSDTIIARNIGRSLKRIPHENAISFMEKTSDNKWLIKKFNVASKAIIIICPALDLSEDLAWTQNGLMLMSNGENIFYHKQNSADGWRPALIKGNGITVLKKASRLAINADNNKLAVVVSE